MSDNPDFTKNPIFAESYWKRPANANQGDLDGIDCYKAVGFAITHWEMAEEKIASQAYLEVAAAHGVEYIFGLPGTSGQERGLKLELKLMF